MHVFGTHFSVRTILPYIQGSRKVKNTNGIFNVPYGLHPEIGGLDGVSDTEFPDFGTRKSGNLTIL